MTGTLRAGVIGWPVEHSISPKLHGYWLSAYGVDGSYAHLPTPADGLEERVSSLLRDGWRGANVTLPHKEEALRLADEATERARAIGAANTLMFRKGRVFADNTDGFGFIENLQDRAPRGWRADRPAVVLGAGGASRAVIWSLLDAGAPELRIANRTRARAEALATEFGPRIAVIDWEETANSLSDAGLIVNTTSLGMKGEPPLELDFEGVGPDAVATDIVYTPLETPFLASAAAHGLATVDGLGMLLHQARPGFEAWFGEKPVVDDRLRSIMLAS